MDEVKRDPCEVCGDTPTEGTSAAGERLCARHGAAEEREAGDVAGDGDAPQWAELGYDSYHDMVAASSGDRS